MLNNYVGMMLMEQNHPVEIILLITIQVHVSQIQQHQMGILLQSCRSKLNHFPKKKFFLSFSLNLVWTNDNAPYDNASMR
jgi:hypothetical protein